MSNYVFTNFESFITENIDNVEIDIYTSDEFLNKYRNQLKNFSSDFKYYSKNDIDFFGNTVYFFTITILDKVIGLAHIRKNPHIDNTYWLSYLSIAKEYENKGYASMLSRYIFKWFSDNNLQFETSSYTDSGFIKLKPLFNKLANEYSVSFIDKDTKI